MPFKTLEAQRKYHKIWYEKNKEHRQSQIYADRDRRRNLARDYVLEYLSENTCVDCPEKDPVVLEFDHVKGDKRSNIAELVYTGKILKKLIEEIAKCEVVCANCHRRRTAKRGNFYKYKPPKHKE